MSTFMSEEEFYDFWREFDATCERTARSVRIPKKKRAAKKPDKRRFIERDGEDCKICRSCTDKIPNGGFGLRKKACENRTVISTDAGVEND